MNDRVSTNRRFFVPCLSLLGLASLCYVLGAAVIFFDLPSASFLRRAFLGGAAWYEREQDSSTALTRQPTVNLGAIDEPDKTCDGFTLCLCSGGPRAVLIDMHGKKAYSWEPPFKSIWPELPRLQSGPVDESAVYFNDARIFPNGDLLVLVEGPVSVRNPSNSYGLVKMDKDARILWTYTADCHHAFDLGEDGTIYALSYNFFVRQLPPGLEYLPTPCMTDSVEVISPQGKQVKRIPLLEAFKDSPFAPLLSSLEKPQLFSDLTPANSPMPAVQDEMRRRDVFHTNAVKVLRRESASKFPMFKPGHLLISPRHLDAIAMLDPDSGKVEWATRGPWHAQHDPSFLDNGHILLFDNLGSAKGSRVLEYDPKTQSFPWWYPGDNGTPFYSRIRGVTQRLPNGNTLIVNSDSGEVFEVTPSRDIVWSCSFGRVSLNCARRYLAEQLPFLAKDRRAR
ncbi:MAG TPA: arylsulfotransferase family protein [Gemmataceae bacterium]|nr:arylsulfotransferase family protein [Gemmataceae bacterium]